MISAKIIADSINELTGDRMTTIELEFPRIILSELNTHRMVSKNAQSSRAIPVQRQIDMVKENPFIPVHFGKNQSGMRAMDEEVTEVSLDDTDWKTTPTDVWLTARNDAVLHAQVLHDAGVHKQVVNRILEPFMFTKAVMSATEWDNFFHLRIDGDAQPEIKLLAEKIYEARRKSSPVTLKEGEWHTPYYGDGYWTPDSPDDLETARKVSVACCAQVSYRRLDDSLEKAERIYDMLIKADKIHASPFEHVAGVVDVKYHLLSEAANAGFTRIECVDLQDIDHLWSGNLKGFVQYRQLLDNHTCWNYEGEIHDND